MKVKFVLFLFLALTSCAGLPSASSSKVDFSSFEVVNVYQISWDKIFDVDEDNYFVFFYKETCSYCHKIQDEIITFASTYIDKTYFIDTDLNKESVKYSNDIESTYYIENIEQLVIAGTPSLIEVSGGKLIANIASASQVLEFIYEKQNQ